MKRLKTGGRIDRSRPISVKFDGKELPAYVGDTLSSAILAGGVSLVGRSFKYHRPRGVYTAGVEEPNAMVHLRENVRLEPNARATVTEAYDGLISTSQNAWPSLKFDIGSVNNWLSPILSAGFYYKTFIGPFKNTTKFWMACETFIRKAAGMGKAGYDVDPDKYDKQHVFCDVLIIGSGPAGLVAALAAGRSGARVLIVEQDFELGGSLLSASATGEEAKWLSEVIHEIDELNNVEIMHRTTAFGAYDSNTFALVERVSENKDIPSDDATRQRYCVVHPKKSIMATGAIERPLIFGENDKPGVMLAHSGRTYLNRFAVLAGEKIVLCTNNDTSYVVGSELVAAGADVTICDVRQSVADGVQNCAREAGIKILLGHGIIKALGSSRVVGVLISKIDTCGNAYGDDRKIEADLVLVSGGWTPVIHLWSQRYGKPKYKEDTGFLPTQELDSSFITVGSAAGIFSLREIISDAFETASDLTHELGFSGNVGGVMTAPDTDFSPQISQSNIQIIGDKSGKTSGKAFVDFQHDVKIDDVDQAYQEGYVSVEHLKRYTTLGMATDQGKLSNLNGLQRMADLSGKQIPEVGTTTFRPPFTPVTIGAIVGHEHGQHFQPTRRSAIHYWHEENGACMTTAGAWMRPWYYPEPGENLAASYIKEARHVRKHVGIIDVSTLGKIAVQGPDSAEFLNRVYVNGWKTLTVGRIRYGVMLREDGIVMDDGATARLGKFDYFMTTTTANAAKVLAFMEQLLQTAWSDLKVHVTSVTDQWSAFAIAGPNSRELLQLVSDANLSREELPNNHFTHGNIAGVKVRIHRMSYSGELAYEVYVPVYSALLVWEAIVANGSKLNLKPYGTEAMGALRIEKGHVAGPEIEGRTTLKDLGLGGFASKKKQFVGSILQQRAILVDERRSTLVGLEFEAQSSTKAGALLYGAETKAEGHGDGWVSSTTYSPALEKNIALAFLKNGQHRHGETIQVVNFVGNSHQMAKVVSPHFFDAEGIRQNG